jgi:O-antigen ligase
MSIRIEDARGRAIKAILCAIIWYTDMIQQRFLEINNMLLILGAALVAVVVFDMHKYPGVLRRIPKAAWLMTAYVVITFFTGFFVTPNISTHITHGMTVLELTVVMLCICYYAVTRCSIMFLVKNYFLLYLVMAIIFLFSPQIALDKNDVVRYSFSAGTNPNAFSMMLTMGIWATLYLVSVKKIPLIAGFATVTVFLYANLLTGSRKGLIAAAMCLVMWIVFCFFPMGTRDYRRKFFKLLGIVLLVGIVIYFILPYYLSSTTAARMNSFIASGSESRERLYREGLDFIRRYPWFGLGYFGYGYFVGTYSHATITEIPVTSGILIACLYFFSYISIIYHLIRCVVRDDRTSLYRSVANRMSFVLMVMMIFYMFMVIHIYQMPSFICFGIIMSSYALICPDADIDSRWVLHRES